MPYSSMTYWITMRLVLFRNMNLKASIKKRFWLLSIQNEKTILVLYRQERQRNMKNEVISSNSQTDWQRLDRITDDEIDFSDCPELTPELFAKAVVRKKSSDSREQVPVTLSIDKDILEWLQSQGQEYQTQINRLLRDYMEKHL